MPIHRRLLTYYILVAIAMLFGFAAEEGGIISPRLGFQWSAFFFFATGLVGCFLEFSWQERVGFVCIPCAGSGIALYQLGFKVVGIVLVSLVGLVLILYLLKRLLRWIRRSDAPWSQFVERSKQAWMGFNLFLPVIPPIMLVKVYEHTEKNRIGIPDFWMAVLVSLVIVTLWRAIVFFSRGGQGFRRDFIAVTSYWCDFLASLSVSMVLLQKWPETVGIIGVWLISIGLVVFLLTDSWALRREQRRQIEQGIPLTRAREANLLLRLLRWAWHRIWPTSSYGFDATEIATPSPVIRVFISSTFVDMNEEREILIKHVIPDLKSKCQAQGILWHEVDLRWGIPPDELKEDRLISLCLQELEKCDFFIAILGERYGSIPPSIPDDVLDLHPHLKEDGIGKSVTELEILTAMQSIPASSDRARFYFRESATPIEQGGSNKAPDHREKLGSLKHRIRESNYPVCGYESPSKLGEMIRKDALDWIAGLGSTLASVDPFLIERSNHWNFAKKMAHGTALREKDLNAINDAFPKHLRVALVGSPGDGKSTILSQWALEYQRQHPDTLVLVHFVNATIHSTNGFSFARRIFSELIRYFHLPWNPPQEPLGLWDTLAEKLKSLPADKPVVFVVDGLEHFDYHAGERVLQLFRPLLSDNIRVVVSTGDESLQRDLGKKHWVIVTPSPLSSATKEQFVEQFFARYGKRLASDQMRRCVTSDRTDDPVFLSTLIEDLRAHGNYETLSARLDQGLALQSATALWDRILAQMETDHRAKSEFLVRDCFILLSLARRGLTEPELADLLGEGKEKLPSIHLAPLLSIAERWLSRERGLIRLLPGPLEDAIQARYLSDESIVQSMHGSLADHFADSKNPERLVLELPWHLRQARRWEELSEMLADHEAVFAIYVADPRCLVESWREIQAATDCTAVKTYALWWEDELISEIHLEMACRILMELQQYPEVLRGTNAILARHSEIEMTSRASAHWRRAYLLQRQGEDAEKDIKDAEKYSIILASIENEHITICGRALLQYHSDSETAFGELAKARDDYRRRSALTGYLECTETERRLRLLQRDDVKVARLDAELEELYSFRFVDQLIQNQSLWKSGE